MTEETKDIIWITTERVCAVMIMPGRIIVASTNKDETVVKAASLVYDADADSLRVNGEEIAETEPQFYEYLGIISQAERANGTPVWSDPS